MRDTIERPGSPSAGHACGRIFPETGLRSWISVRPSVSDMIAKEVPGWAGGKHICMSNPARFRRLYVEHLLEGERGEFGDLDWQVTANLEAGQSNSPKPFDPYPFILLNLLLSFVAALPAPIIMMGQRRKDAEDRLRAENDDRVNLNSGQEIRLLREKVAHQLARQWERLAEMQQLQIDLLEDGMDGRH